MRFWIGGPRILGLRTGISFGPEDFRSAASRAPSASTDGGSFLYVITGDHERVKVGVSANPNRRRAQLQTGSPFPLRLAYSAVTPGTGYDIEAEAKRTLNRYRCVQGSGDEWYNVPVEMAVAALQAAAFKRSQPLVPLTQEQLDKTLEIASLPKDQIDAFLAAGPFGQMMAAPQKPSKLDSIWLAPMVGGVTGALVMVSIINESQGLLGVTLLAFSVFCFWMAIRGVRQKRQAKARELVLAQASQQATAL